MLNAIRAAVIGLAAMTLSSVAIAQAQTQTQAQAVDMSRFFFGAGLSSNDMSGTDTAIGWQLFGGYVLGEIMPKLFIDAEVGYMDSGDMERSGGGDVNANGLWATAVGRYLIVPNVELLGRIGLDFGDDDGLMAGVGAGLLLNKNMKLRFEYVKRDHLDSWQFNFVYRP